MSSVYPMASPIIPMASPIFIICFCVDKPVEWAIAFGGVLIGRHIAMEAEMATPMRITEAPPIPLSDVPIPLHTTANIGTRSAVVAVFEMKFERM